MFFLVLFFPIFAKAFTYSVTELRGTDAFFSQSGSTIRNKLQNDTKLSDDDTVQTAESSSVFLLSNAGHQISIGPNSAIYLGSARNGADETTVISLLRGFVRSIVKGNGTHSKIYELKTTSVAIGVRGTDFLSVLDGNSLRVYLADGVLALSGDQEMKTGNKASWDSSGNLKISPMELQEFTMEIEKINLGNSANSSVSSKPLIPIPNASNAEPRKTQLMLAIERRDIASVKALLASGVNKNEKDSQGRTAYDYARSSENREIQDLLFR